jgi:threonine aldolase
VPPGSAFASDNCTRICPEAWRALEAANSGYAASYGEDEWTRRACDLVRDVFETNCDVYFVATGTAANALGVATMSRSLGSVVCHELSHIATSECGAVELLSGGMQLATLPGALGKVAPGDIERHLEERGNGPEPASLSVTQATELGTLYSATELAFLGEVARGHALRFHMDGARFANAVAALGRSPADLTWRIGVDALSFGMSKNGGQVGDAVVFFRQDLAREFARRCKQAGQLCSKMRYLAAPWVGMLEQGAWLRHATHANAMARNLHGELAQLPGVRILFPVETNAVFVDLPRDALAGMRSVGWHIPSVFGDTGCRLMCAWCTTAAEIETFVAELRVHLASSK